jgi:hypothetical protein
MIQALRMLSAAAFAAAQWVRNPMVSNPLTP